MLMDVKKPMSALIDQSVMITLFAQDTAQLSVTQSRSMFAQLLLKMDVHNHQLATPKKKPILENTVMNNTVNWFVRRRTNFVPENKWLMDAMTLTSVSQEVKQLTNLLIVMEIVLLHAETPRFCAMDREFLYPDEPFGIV